jgi:uncharacterized membrane protein YeaQ/YmgE (transglycosylase-associated protein family)
VAACLSDEKARRLTGVEAAPLPGPDQLPAGSLSGVIDRIRRCRTATPQPCPEMNVAFLIESRGHIMGIIWTIIIGFIAGVIAKLITPGKNEPSGFILTTILGIVGAFVATFLGQAVGWYRAGEGAGLIGAIVGAVIVLVIWGAIAARRGPTSSY